MLKPGKEQEGADSSQDDQGGGAGAGQVQEGV